ncbi:hypothetical protein EI546_08565 [Aequorivita sp. H23M31]|uniref:Lipoprotein n=1 Tax=Aequorivita ciconiae TaxID=2494375 RepID=A0A410G3F3_9FLAO|nr:hypothetical protein [Aequorivita sp. H23M31]QAA81769.1 hypothetical protein EI546_08565 [Aequorivita sp. H23M31]
MFQKLFLLAILSLFLASCQFTESLVLNEDGSGTISVEVNLNEMMAFGAMGGDSVVTKMDTIIYMKQFLEEKKDSIATLPKGEQMKLKKLENFNIHLKINTEASEMEYDIATTFKSIEEVDDLMNALNQAGNFVPGMDQNQKKDEPDSPDIIGVRYSFDKGVFKRDAYIKDKTRHQKEVDSLKQSEAFLGGVFYTLSYKFPRPIKKVSDPEATLSNDKKGLTLKKSFIDYFKNPDLLDLEVELEK